MPRPPTLRFRPERSTARRWHASCCSNRRPGSIRQRSRADRRRAGAGTRIAVPRPVDAPGRFRSAGAADGLRTPGSGQGDAHADHAPRRQRGRYRALLPALLPMFRASGALRRGTPRPEGVEELAAAAATFGSRRAEASSCVTSLRARPGQGRSRHQSGGGSGASCRSSTSPKRSAVLLPAADDHDGERLVRRPEPPRRRRRGDRGGTAARRPALPGYVRSASTADLSAWTGVSTSDFRAAIAALDDEGSLVRFRDEAGRELLDLPDAPRPEDDAVALPRLLPMWEEILLGFRDRTRIISDEDRARVVGRNGDCCRRSSWTAGSPVLVGRGGRCRHAERARPFGRLAEADRRALEAEADRLARFVGPLEPAVYARYRTSGARRH